MSKKLLSRLEPLLQKEFPNLFEGKIDHFKLTPTLFDLAIVPSVYHFYEQKQKSPFLKYFSCFIEKDLSHLPSYKYFLNHVNLLKAYVSYLKKKIKLSQEWTIAGDFHPNLIKIYHDKEIIYKNFLGVEEVIFRHNPEFFAPFFPEYKFKNGIIIRKFVKTKNAFYQPEEYYFNFGKLLAWAWFFRATDLHRENFLIKDYKQPFLYDLECLFFPKVKKSKFDIKSTGLISDRQEDNTSALFGGILPVYSYLQPIIFFNKKNQPLIKWKVPSWRKSLNLPQKGFVHPKKFLPEILKGYEEATQVLLSHSEELVNQIGNERFLIRIIIRPTRIYRYFLMKMAYPQYHLKTKIPTLLKKELQAAPTLSYGRTNKSLTIKYELKSLESLAIPYFYAKFHEKGIYSSDHQKIGSISASPYDQWQEHVNKFPSSVKQQRRKIQTMIKNYPDKSVR